MHTIKRIYEPLAKADSYHIFADHLWPRKISPSDAMRKVQERIIEKQVIRVKDL